MQSSPPRGGWGDDKNNDNEIIKIPKRQKTDACKHNGEAERI